MILYHVSCKVYKVGDKFSSKTTTIYHTEKTENGEGWVDLELNKYKPNNAPNREQCYYAFDSIGNCFAFINSVKCETGNPNYYKVKMIDPISAPMCLTDLLLKEGQESDQIGTIANEYWNSTFGWKYREYLSAEMEIVKDLNEPSNIEKASGQMNYQRDYELRKEKFGK